MSDREPVQTPSFEAQPPVEAATVSAPPPAVETPVAEEPTVGTGSYIGAGCAIAMLVLTVLLIGVVFLLRWIG